MHTRPTDMPGAAGSDIRTLRALAPFLWDYRGRVVLALACLVLAKVANVGIPLVLKDIVDSLDMDDASLLVLPLTLLLMYGALRLASSLFTELRDSVFARVRHGAMRKVSLRVLEHLHRLSLRYHLERKTGGLSRDIDRGTRSVSSLMNYMVFSILPTLVEKSVEFIGQRALQDLAGREPERRLRGCVISGDPIGVLPHPVPLQIDGDVVGQLRSGSDSPRFGENIGLALIDSRCQIGDVGSVTLPADLGTREVRLVDLPFDESLTESSAD